MEAATAMVVAREMEVSTAAAAAEERVAVCTAVGVTAAPEAVSKAVVAEGPKVADGVAPEDLVEGEVAMVGRIGHRRRRRALAPSHPAARSDRSGSHQTWHW